MSKMKIDRDYTRTEHDNFVINVEQHCVYGNAAHPIYNDTGELVGWIIKPIHE